MKSLDALTAAILAGGLGTRLRAAVQNQPKVLANVSGRPFLSYILDQLAVTGLKDIVLCTGYLGNQVQATFGSFYRGLHLSYSQEVFPRGTAGALRLALPLLNSDPVLVMNGDSYCEADFRAFLSQHSMSGAQVSILLAHIDNTARYGHVVVSGRGEVISFEEKGARKGSGLINAGVYFLARSVLSAIPSDKNVSLENDIFPLLIGRGLYGCLSHGRFLDIGTPESYAAAEEFFTTIEHPSKWDL